VNASVVAHPLRDNCCVAAFPEEGKNQATTPPWTSRRVLKLCPDPQLQPGPADLFCGLLPINRIIEPLARVTLLDVDDGSKWQIDYRLQQSPLVATEVSTLTPLSD
jgi:hypothetical protein